MKYQNFAMKLLTAAIIAGSLCHYQSVAAARATVVAENEAKIAEVEEYNRQIQLENAKRQAASLYYENGTYEGEGSGYGGPVRVLVTVEYDVLTDIQVISHDAEDPAYFEQAEKLVDMVVSGQTTDVDVVAGASFSSRGILEGIENALDKAVRK